MADSGGAADLGPLPKSDENAELQRTSIKALQALLLATDCIVFRDERIEDYGVDGSFELKVAGFMTNFRAQVQLKGTKSIDPNQDGSMSLPVEPKNLNYLLNGPIPIYVLFDAKRNEFWYVWAQEENRRLESADRKWKQQTRVNLRFTKRLTADALSQVRDQILHVGRSLRQINDSIARSTTSERVVFQIDPASLETTDPSKARIILMANGPTIVASGYPRKALQLLALVDTQTGNMPRIQLIAGYAEYTLGKYYNSLGHLRQAMARSQELSGRDRAFVNRLRDACELKLGIIDTETYQRRAEERTRALTGVESLEAQLEIYQHQCLTARNPDVRPTLASKVREVTQQILNHPDATEPAKLAASLAHLYIQGTEANMEVTNQKGLSRMRASMFPNQGQPMAGRYGFAIHHWSDWEKWSDAALKKAYALGHPILIGEAHAVVLAVYLNRLLSQRVEALFYDKPFRVASDTASKVLAGIESALAVYNLSGAVEGRLRVNVLNMDFLEIEGDLAGAKKLAKQIYPEAEAMCFASFAERAKETLEDRSLLMRIERDVKQLKLTDKDISMACMSDGDVKRFAQDILLSCRLPESRLGVVEECCKSLRVVAQERCNWCRHLDVWEEKPAEPDPATAFTHLPNQRCICEKFGHETRIITTDLRGLIGAFKQMYCTNCKDRVPLQAPGRG
ncbi:MAG: DUF4365 domain-containing protein [Terriglobia bacterium]